MSAFRFPPEVEQMMLRAGLCMGEKPEGTASVPQPVAPSATPGSRLYVKPDWFDLLMLSLTDPQEHGACLFGGRGTGKTTAVQEAAKAVFGESWREKVVVMQCAAGMTLDDLKGIRDLRDGKTVFTPGPLPLALARDGWLVAEEANMVHPGVWSECNTLTDGSGTPLRLIDGTVLQPGPNFKMILCFNEGTGYAGAREVNAALRDRLMPIYTTYMGPDAEARVLVDRTQVDETTARSLVKFANAVRAANAQLGFDLSPRALMRLLRVKKGLVIDWVSAFNRTILDLMGDPVVKKPQRDIMAQIAQTSGIGSWPDPQFGPAPALDPDANADEHTTDGYNEDCDCEDCRRARGET